jgi:hypothetical protein
VRQLASEGIFHNFADGSRVLTVVASSAEQYRHVFVLLEGQKNCGRNYEKYSSYLQYKGIQK